MTIGIYKIQNLKNGKIYIGQSIHIEKRWQEHCRLSTKSLISNAIKEYGKDNFSFQILEECLEKDLDKKEQEYIIKYNSIVPQGYNIILTSSERSQNFFNYNKEIFDEIIKDIKEDILSFKDIAKKYELDLSMIYYLNRGDYHTIENESYPLRKVKDMTKKRHYCIDCGIEIGKNALRCSKCDHIKQRVCERPSREVLKEKIRKQSFVKIAAEYGVSDKAISKWCEKYGLPFRKKDINKITDEDWKKI